MRCFVQPRIWNTPKKENASRKPSWPRLRSLVRIGKYSFPFLDVESLWHGPPAIHPYDFAARRRYLKRPPETVRDLNHLSPDKSPCLKIAWLLTSSRP